MSLEIKPHQGAGAEILGVDLMNLKEAELNQIKAVYAEYGLVFFRDQQLNEQGHIELARKFGNINVNRFFKAHPEYPEIAMVLKEADQETNIGGGWHTDHSYDEDPAMGSILVARDLPETGGDTWFVSMYHALDSLSEGMKSTLRGLRAVHSAKHVFGTDRGYSQSQKAESGRIGNAAAADELRDPIHPVVIKHPLSGKEALYVNPAFTLRFDGWTAEESAPLLSYLYQQCIREDHICQFRWQPGSVAFWDNRSTWHFAQNDYQGHRREMHRITLDGCLLKAA